MVAGESGEVRNPGTLGTTKERAVAEQRVCANRKRNSRSLGCARDDNKERIVVRDRAVAKVQGGCPLLKDRMTGRSVGKMRNQKGHRLAG